MRFSDYTILERAGEDRLARIVMERLARAARYKNDTPIFQYKSFQHQCELSTHQYRREYTSDQEAKLYKAFNRKPTRFYGLTNIKVDATKSWKRDLVINNLDSMFTTFPTPEPELDEASLARIREQAERKLYSMLADAGVTDPSILMRGKGLADPRFEDFLNSTLPILKKEEFARIKSVSQSAAERAKSRLTDMLVQSNFRQVYGSFSHEQILYGMGFMKFPDYRKIQTIKHQNGKVVPTFEIMPMFRNPSVFNMFPVDDGYDLQTNTAVIEVTEISKYELVKLLDVEGYDRRNIEGVLHAYSTFYDIKEEKREKSKEVMKVAQAVRPDRNWLGLEVDAKLQNEYQSYWGPDGKIPMVIHEGFLTGLDLLSAGHTGFAENDLVNATVIVVGGITIRCSVSKSPKDFERSYFAVPFNRFGTGIWDVVGMGAKLRDTEERINIILHQYEENIDWAARPPILYNPATLANAGDAINIAPGGKYEIDQDGFGERVMDTIKPMSPVSAQYHLLYSQVTGLMRQADEECGIPAFAYSSQDFGRSSLGEYSQRMSNALRTIKDAALEEDNWLIEPAFEGMFNRIMQEDPSMAVGQDVKMQVRGLTGLLKDDESNTRKQSILGNLISLDNTRPGLVPDAAMRYGVREFMQDAGYPVDLLGLTDPTISLAVADAAATSGMGGGGVASNNIIQQQVPSVDGRSGPIAQGAVANPDGTSEY